MINKVSHRGLSCCDTYPSERHCFLHVSLRFSASICAFKPLVLPVSLWTSPSRPRTSVRSSLPPNMSDKGESVAEVEDLRHDQDVGNGSGSGSGSGSANVIDDDNKVLATHSSHIAPQTGAGSGVRRGLQPPEFLLNMSMEERLELETKLKRKIDLRLMPAIILMYILNYIDRLVQPTFPRHNGSTSPQTSSPILFCSPRGFRGSGGGPPTTSQRGKISPSMTDRHTRTKQEQHRGCQAGRAGGGPRPVVDRVRDGRVHPLRGLPADADPLQPLPQQAGQAGPVPAGVHDRLGRHLGRHRVVLQRGWAAVRAVLPGFCGGCLFPWCAFFLAALLGPREYNDECQLVLITCAVARMPLLPLVLVHPQGAGL